MEQILKTPGMVIAVLSNAPCQKEGPHAPFLRRLPWGVFVGAVLGACVQGSTTKALQPPRTVHSWRAKAALQRIGPHDLRLHYLGRVDRRTNAPMLSDTWETPIPALSSARAGIKQAMERRRRQGDLHLAFLEFPQQTDADGYGCDWHPSLAKHAHMADELVALLRSLRVW
jgi:hypothetical protein